MRFSKRFITAAALTAQVLVVSVVMMLSSGNAQAADPVIVSGRVTNQSATGIANVSVTAEDPTTHAVAYGPVATASDGSYALPVTAGVYDFRFNPPSGSGLNPVTNNGVVVFADTTVNVQLTPVTHTFSGTLRDGAGQPVAGMQLRMTSNNGKTGEVTADANGNFNFQLQPDKYSLSVYDNFGRFNGKYHWSYFYSDSRDSSPEFDLTNANITQDLKIETAPLTVTVKDSNGNTLPNIAVQALTGFTTSRLNLFPSQVSTYYADVRTNNTTDSTGKAALTSVIGASYSQRSGATNTDANICAAIGGQNVCIPAPLTITGATDITITQPVTHAITGILRDGNGQPIVGMQLRMTGTHGQSGEATTNSSGRYSFQLQPDMYSLAVYDNFGRFNGNYHWNYINAFPPNNNITEFDLTNADVTQDLTLQTVPLTVTVKNGSGQPVPNATVQALSTHSQSSINLLPSQQATYNVDLRSNGTTNASGVAQLTSIVGVKYSQQSGTANTQDNICVTISGQNVCVPAPVTVTGPMSLTIQQPIVRTFSGALRDSAGQPVAGMQLRMTGSAGQSGEVTADANGNFSFQLQPDKYSLAIYDNFGRFNGKYHWSYFYSDSRTSPPELDLTTADLAKDLTLQTTRLSVTIKDYNGNPLPNIPVQALSYFDNGSLTLYQNQTSTYGVDVRTNNVTNQNGVADLTSIKGAAYTLRNGPGNINDNICASISGSNVCIAAPLTITGDTNIVLQQAPPVPAAPTGLTAQSPTQVPSLSWSAVALADSYSVYRNGTKIATVNDASYVDYAAPEGTVNYAVTANNASGESTFSNSIAVVVDRTQPVLTYTVTPSPNPAGWNNSNVVVSFTCSDELSGVQDCPADVTVSAEAAAQDVTGTATDQAGNTITKHATINIDKTAPSLSYTVTPAANAAGWHNTAVVISFACNDGLSGIQNCPMPVTVSGEGANQDIARTATDVAGNSVTKHVILNIDKTAPTITHTANPVANAAGWNKGDVTVSFACSDSLSGIKECANPVTVTSEGANLDTPGDAIDQADNKTTDHAVVNIDRTAPTLNYSVSPVANAAGWNNSSVLITYTCSDSLSGIQDCPPATTVDTEGANLDIPATATDRAGNKTTKHVLLKIDKTAPSASNPTMSSTVVLPNNTVNLSANAADGLSGVARGEYYIDNDPGPGNGTNMAYSNGKITASRTINGLSIGRHRMYMRSLDAAGNWSAPVSVAFTFI